MLPMRAKYSPGAPVMVTDTVAPGETFDCDTAREGDWAAACVATPRLATTAMTVRWTNERARVEWDM
jgi:hypothetical protein